MVPEPIHASSSATPSGALRRTGDPDMDRQHMHILQALERLHESLLGPFPLENLGARLRQLETLTMEHFRDEELLMEQWHYSLLASHRAEHELIVDRCHQLLDQYGSPDSPPLEQLPQALIALFTHHIETVDMDYAAMLQAQEV